MDPQTHDSDSRRAYQCARVNLVKTWPVHIVLQNHKVLSICVLISARPYCKLHVKLAHYVFVSLCIRFIMIVPPCKMKIAALYSPPVPQGKLSMCVWHRGICFSPAACRMFSDRGWIRGLNDPFNLDLGGCERMAGLQTKEERFIRSV